MLRKTLFAALALAGSPAALAQPNPGPMIDAIEPQVIAWRRHVHENAELSFQEVKTAAYVAAALRAMPGIEVQTGIGNTPGIKAVLKGGKPGPVIALRADMDALPIEERNDLPFRSRQKAQWQGKETGVMHACGHDAHVAMLLGVADVFSKMRADLPGTVVFLFQPAEEWGSGDSPSGAYKMVEAGVLENPKVEAVFGQHVSSGHPGGSVSYRSGGVMASSDGFTITIKGAGGHGAMPWDTKDPIVTGAQMVTLLQSVVSRQANLSNGAAVVTVGQFNGGSRVNIIPETAVIAGTIRTLNEDTRVRVHDAVARMAKGVAEASGLTADVSITRGYPVLSNDPALTARMLASLERATGPGKVGEVPPRLASEDFGAYSSKVPGFFWFLNASPHPDKAGAPNHSPLFQMDEKYMKTGVKAMVNVALDYLQAAGRK